jgi:hypothetical protein
MCLPYANSSMISQIFLAKQGTSLILATDPIVRGYFKTDCAAY